MLERWSTLFHEFVGKFNDFKFILEIRVKSRKVKMCQRREWPLHRREHVLYLWVCDDEFNAVHTINAPERRYEIVIMIMILRNDIANSEGKLRPVTEISPEGCLSGAVKLQIEIGW